jgi:hypothetical protein
MRTRSFIWEQMLQPQSIPERLRLVVSIPPWGDVEQGENGRYTDRAVERAKALSEECARDPQPWMEYLHVVLQGEQRQAFPFGQRLGQCLEEPKLFIHMALKELASLNKEDANPIVLLRFTKVSLHNSSSFMAPGGRLVNQFR